MNKGKHFTRICVDCGRVMQNVAGNRRFCAACIREHRAQYSRTRNENRAHTCMWYTVWDAKTGDLLASGTSDLCARRLGYKNANSFASAVVHGINGRGRHTCKKYTFVRERIDRREVDSLPPVRPVRKKPAGAGTPTSCKG